MASLAESCYFKYDAILTFTFFIFTKNTLLQFALTLNGSTTLNMTLVANQYLHIVDLVVYLGFVCHDLILSICCEKSRHV